MVVGLAAPGAETDATAAPTELCDLASWLYVPRGNLLSSSSGGFVSVCTVVCTVSAALTHMEDTVAHVAAALVFICSTVSGGIRGEGGAAAPLEEKPLFALFSEPPGVLLLLV